MAVQSVAAVDTHLINTANTAVLNMAMSSTAGASAKFSIAVWINANWGSSTVANGRCSMVGLYGPAAAPTSALQIGSSAGSGDLTCWTWGGTTMVGTATDYMTQYNNTWVHVAYTYDGTTHTLYLNGSPIVSSTVAQITGNLQAVTISGYPTGGTAETWNHIVDSYGLYNRVLTANEILTMYNAQGSRHGIDYGIVAAYEFDEGIEGAGATTVLDLSGSALHLLLTGAGTPGPKYTYTTTYAGSNIRPVIVT
jgi:hypothetical protein